jgi:hypothetical protein
MPADIEIAREASIAAKPPNWPPRLILGFLLILCAVRGLYLAAGLVRPPDIDSLRDVGFIQGFLDGNWFGDPAYAGEWPVLSASRSRIGSLSRTIARG